MCNAYRMLPTLITIMLVGCHAWHSPADTGHRAAGGDEDDGTVKVVADPDKVFLGETVGFEATVKDDDGNLVSGQQVDLQHGLNRSRPR